MSAYPEELWELVEARRDAIAAMNVTPEAQEELRKLADDLELIALAVALKIPAAVSGHAARVRGTGAAIAIINALSGPEHDGPAEVTPKDTREPKGYSGRFWRALQSIFFGRRTDG